MTAQTPIVKDRSQHPCFNKGVSGGCGRAHLPVAPKCNLSCNYCNRKYDCVNESRPGVTSSILSPAQAVRYMDEVLAKEPRITVAGIAGPGDPMANPVETLTTIRLLKEKHPHLLFCLSTNGLALPPHLDELKKLDVTHVTVTVNAIDPAIGEKIYSWARDGKVLYRGEQAAKILLQRQMEAIQGLKERGMTVKINTILIPGVNDHHVVEVAARMRGMGVDIQNIIPLHPTADTPFAEIREPSKAEVRELREEAGKQVSQMTHCRRCRADAVGLLCKDRSMEMLETLRACSTMVVPIDESRPYVAVATREGMLINQHLGEAQRFQIWERKNGDYRLVEDRPAPRPGTGPKRWTELAALLQDCRALLCAALGDQPRMLLEEYGVTPHVCTGFIRDALELVYTSGNLKALKGRRQGLGEACCTGTGKGCS